MSKWKCRECGDCCRLAFLLFPKELLKKNGECIYLKNNKCEIYDNRPNVCRTKNNPDKDKIKACKSVRELVRRMKNEIA